MNISLIQQPLDWLTEHFSFTKSIQIKSSKCVGNSNIELLVLIAVL